ncbi:MAG: hypothetical protein MJE77_13885 [Proteobacteria bacterium]|nr:hypothetical protein [Pseudomonadota bacterium]
MQSDSLANSPEGLVDYRSVTIETADGDIDIKAPKGAVRFHGKKVNITTKGDFSGKAGGKQRVQPTQ